MQDKRVTQLDVEKYAVLALKRWLKKAMTHVQIRKRVVTAETKNYTIDISICTASKMAKINLAFRKINGATDILSFPTHEFFQRQGMLGDLVLCAPVALKQAKEIGHSWKKEVDVLLVHGILHLLHFDHETSASDAKDMSKWEEKILGRGYANSLIKRVHEIDEVETGSGPGNKSRHQTKMQPEQKPAKKSLSKSSLNAKAKVSAKSQMSAKTNSTPKARKKIVTMAIT